MTLIFLVIGLSRCGVKDDHKWSGNESEIGTASGFGSWSDDSDSQQPPIWNLILTTADGYRISCECCLLMRVTYGCYSSWTHRRLKPAERSKPVPKWALSEAAVCWTWHSRWSSQHRVHRGENAKREGAVMLLQDHLSPDSDDIHRALTVSLYSWRILKNSHHSHSFTDSFILSM